MSDETTELEVQNTEPQLVQEEEATFEGLTDDEKNLVEQAKEAGVEIPEDLGKEVEQEPEGEPEEEVAEATETQEPQEVDRLALLEKELEFSRRQMSQIQSFLAKQNNNPQPQETSPQSLLEQLPQEQRDPTISLVKEIIKQEYGDQLDRASQAAEKVESEEQLYNAEARIQARLGKDLDAVKPVIQEMFAELTEQVSRPGPEGEQAMALIEQYKMFPEAIADAAKLRYLERAGEKSSQAKAEQIAKNAKVATRASGKGRTASGDILERFKNGKATMEEVHEALRSVQG